MCVPERFGLKDAVSNLELTNRTSDFRKGDYTVLPVDQKTVRELVAAYHYSQKCSGVSTYRHGLFRKDTSTCIGITQWIPPMLGLGEKYASDPKRVLTLSRLVVAPELPKNAAGFLLSHSIRLIRKDGRFCVLLTYADTWRGHLGTVYQATNWKSAGMTDPRPVWIDSSGRMVAYRQGTTTYSSKQMVAQGHTLLGKFPKHRYVLHLGGKCGES